VQSPQEPALVVGFEFFLKHSYSGVNALNNIPVQQFVFSQDLTVMAHLGFLSKMIRPCFYAVSMGFNVVLQADAQLVMRLDKSGRGRSYIIQKIFNYTILPKVFTHPSK